MSETPAASAIQTSACPTLTTSASDTTETTESKFYEPKPADQVTNLTLPDACSQPNGKDDYTTNTGYVFTYTCGFDYPGNDIVPILAYTAFDCMHACAMYTEINSGKENVTQCDSIVFNREMANNYEVKGGNCWLKTGTRDLFPAADLMPTFLYAKRNS